MHHCHLDERDIGRKEEKKRYGEGRERGTSGTQPEVRNEMKNPK